MKLKLHNKYEIYVGNKKYILYNTLLNTVYDKISNLEQFTSHIAIGTGTSEKTANDTKLSSYLMTFKAHTEEIQCDTTNETLYIKKAATIDESFTETFSFSELGITNTSDFDPIIFNHALLKNKDGEVVSITRNPGDVMEIKVTIYLELNPESKALFVQGENDFIKQILGEELSCDDNNLYAIRGDSLLSNGYINKTSLDLTNAVVCKKTITRNDDGSISLSYSAEMGEGDTEEILLIYNNQVCLRLNTLEYNAPQDVSDTFSCGNGNFIDVDKYIKNIKGVYTISDNGNIEHTSHSVVNYSRKLTDKVSNLFDQNFNYNTKRYVSKDGKMIAFILNSYLHIYKYENYEFNKVNTTQISANNIMKVFMFEDIILVLRTAEPYVSIYKIDNNIATPKTVSLSMYDASVYSYDWLDADATLTLNNKILIGIIINDSAQTPIVITLTENSSGTYTDDFIRPTIKTAKKVYSIYKNNYVEPRVSFITDTYADGTYYLIEEFLDGSSTFASNSDTAYGLLNNTQGIQVSGRTVISQKKTSPYLMVYYYPNFDFGGNSFSTGIKHYCSKDGSYIIAKYSDETYKIFNFHEIGNPTEFTSGFPPFVDFTTICDFEFVGDFLLVFTTNNEEPLYAIALKNVYTRIENMEDENKSYLIEYQKYDILGSKPLDGVKVHFNIKFGINSEE